MKKTLISRVVAFTFIALAIVGPLLTFIFLYLVPLLLYPQRDIESFYEYGAMFFSFIAILIGAVLGIIGTFILKTINRHDEDYIKGQFRRQRYFLIVLFSIFSIWVILASIYENLPYE